LTDADILATVYYLLWQDWIEEAQAAFSRVDPDLVPTKLQYDYCAAYMAMFEENPVKARSIAARYLGHPVDRWRNTFTAVINPIDEASGKGPRVADPDDKGQNPGATGPATREAVAAAVAAVRKELRAGGEVSAGWLDVIALRAVSKPSVDRISQCGSSNCCSGCWSAGSIAFASTAATLSPRPAAASSFATASACSTASCCKPPALGCSSWPRT